MGVFGLSQAACLRLVELGYDGLIPIPEEEQSTIFSNNFYGVTDIPRDNLLFVQFVREMGMLVNGLHALLKIVEIPCNIGWSIKEYDGYEWVAEDHRIWE